MIEFNNSFADNTGGDISFSKINELSLEEWGDASNYTSYSYIRFSPASIKDLILNHSESVKDLFIFGLPNFSRAEVWIELANY